MMFLKVQNYKKCGMSPRSLSPRIARICTYLHLLFFILYITTICLVEENIIENAFFCVKIS